MIQPWISAGRKQNLETCVLDTNRVDSEDFLISLDTDSAIQALHIIDKPGVKFLPTNLFSTFPNLVAFQVWNCSVTTITNHFKGLYKLRTLNLDHNKIENVANDAFEDLISLETLDFKYNKVGFLGENTFESMKDLKQLNLGFNYIQVLPSKIFGSLAKVEFINLQQNKISTLDENIFENATGLRGINLIANKLERIPSGLFRNNLKLEGIGLAINNIKFIDEKTFNHLPSLNFVDLRDNFCVDARYDKINFGTMRQALEQACNEINNLHSKHATAISETFDVLGLPPVKCK